MDFIPKIVERNVKVSPDSLLADSDPLLNCAVVADYRATPLETTLAPFRPFLTDHVVASATNQPK